MSVPTIQENSLAELTRNEIDIQVATAHQYPRIPSESINNAIELATSSMKTSKSCLYFRPVGKGKDGIQNFSQDGSIRLAEILIGTWGNIRAGCRTVGEMDHKIVVQGICHDLQTNAAVTKECSKAIYSKSYGNKEGWRFTDNQIQVIEMAAGSIALRNAIFTIVSKAVVNQILDKVIDKIVGDDINETWKLLIEKFKEMEVPEKKIMKILKVEKTYNKSQVVKLIGIYNIIKDKVCTVSDCFGIGKGGKPEVEGVSKKKPGRPKKTTAAKKEDEPGEMTEKEYSDNIESMKGQLLEMGMTDQEINNDFAMLLVKKGFAGDPSKANKNEFIPVLEAIKGFVDSKKQ